VPRATLQVEGLREAQRKIVDVGARARLPEPALRSPGTRRALQESERRRFSRYRFRPDTRIWVARKRREGLSSKTMIATGRLQSALENANYGEGVRQIVHGSMLTWGIKAGRSDVYYAAPLAKGGRKAVAIDRLARIDIAERVQHFIAYGFLD
jgi:hypothetical protein